MPRFLTSIGCAACVVSLGLASSSLAGAAIASPAAASGDAEAMPPAKSAGTIEGDVVAVDYRSGTIAVRAGSRRIDVLVVPGTNIIGHDNFHTIADIKKGSHVQIILSQRAGTLIAQIVRLR